MNFREKEETLEKKTLNDVATLSINTKGRTINELKCDIRTEFQRDRDRILHSNAFRKLKNKTQVFMSTEADGFRTRLTHTLEVSQIARTISRVLGLNEDLTEAIALAHDVGHPPFGHAGERTLNRLSENGFTHQEQGVRVVEVLEKDGLGLNLTEEVKDGILNHSLSGTPNTLEGQVVRISDKIAYLNHDLEDAISVGFIKYEDIPEDIKSKLSSKKSERINYFVRDVIKESQNQNEIKMSKDVEKFLYKFRKFMIDEVYHKQKENDDKAIHLVEALYKYYQKHEDLLKDYQGDLDTKICDYLSSLTDKQMLEKFKEIYLMDFKHLL